MDRKFGILIIILFCIAFSTLYVNAKTTSTSNTSVDTKPAPQWQTKNYSVKTDKDAEYDADSNGFLDSTESRRALNDRYEMIQTTGETGVDMDLLQEYDADSNGSIDAREAQDIRDDIE